MLNLFKKNISCYSVFISALIWLSQIGVAQAEFRYPHAAPPDFTDDNIFPPLEIGTMPQVKVGGVIVNNLSVVNGAQFSGIGIGTTPDITNGLHAAGDLRANLFCIGLLPAPDGCITSWLGIVGLSGGQTNSLVRWLSSMSGSQPVIGNSSISESGVNINVASALLSKNLNITGNLNVDSDVKLRSGVKLSGLAGSSFSGLTSTTKILSVDQATGEVFLTNADCTTR